MKAFIIASAMVISSTAVRMMAAAPRSLFKSDASPDASLAVSRTTSHSRVLKAEASRSGTTNLRQQTQNIRQQRQR